MKKKVIFIVVIILLVVVFFVLHNNKKIRIKHIFLITLDTTRADHLGCYGYPVKTTPFIDSLAKKGVVFKNGFSQSATTCPSHTSIMTGLYTSQHRVLANGYILDDSYNTLAEILKKNGFRTAAFTSTDRHFLASNLDQGFEMYEEPIDTVKTYGYKYRPARLTINNAILWLDNFSPKEKLFMWIHLFDPHLPYHPPEKYKKIIKKQLKKDYLKRFVKIANVNLAVYNNSFDDYYQAILNYDSEIRYVDEEIERFFNIIKRKGLEKDSLIIITGDHGEGLGQHNWLEHGTQIYQEEIHIPLIFYFGEEKIRNRIKHKIITTSVENFDIFSTIIDLIKINNKKSYLSKVESISLLNTMFSDDPSINKLVFTERRYYNKRKIYSDNIPFWKKRYERGIKVCLQGNGYKYIYRSEFKDEFYDLTKDPYELNNIIDRNSKIAHTFKKQILKLLSKFKNKKYKKAGKKIFKKLKSLGYIE